MKDIGSKLHSLHGKYFQGYLLPYAKISINIHVNQATRPIRRDDTWFAANRQTVPQNNDGSDSVSIDEPSKPNDEAKDSDRSVRLAAIDVVIESTDVERPVKLDARVATEDGHGTMARKEGGGDRGESFAENPADKPTVAR